MASLALPVEMEQPVRRYPSGNRHALRGDALLCPGRGTNPADGANVALNLQALLLSVVQVEPPAQRCYHDPWWPGHDSVRALCRAGPGAYPPRLGRDDHRLVGRADLDSDRRQVGCGVVVVQLQRQAHPPAPEYVVITRVGQ